MLKANFERVIKKILFNFKSKFVKTRIIIDRKPAKVSKVMFSTTKKIAILLSTNINISRFDFFFSSLFSLECESPYVSSSHLALLPCECSLSEVSDSPLYEDIVEIVVKYNKNIRRVE
jgi:hypothetical protein